MTEMDFTFNSGSNSVAGSKKTGDPKKAGGSKTGSKSVWASSKNGRTGATSGGGHTSSSFRNELTSSVSKARAIEMSNLQKRTCHASMMLVLILGGMIPFLATTLSAWYVLSNNTSENLDSVYNTAGIAIEGLIFSKLDSVVEAEIEAFRYIYENVVKVVEAGAFLEYAISEYDYDKKQQRTAYWTQIIAQSYHYKSVFFIHSCHGHVLGTGYNAKNKTFLAKYTDLHVFDYNQKDFVSTLGGVYYGEDGCNTPDYFAETTKESTHTKAYTDSLYWKNLLDPEYTDHDTTHLEDGRLRQWYMETRGSTDECKWTEAYPAYQEPFKVDDYVQTLTRKAYDSSGKEVGLVGVDVSVNRVQGFIAELSASFTGTVSVVLSKDERVMAATHTGNVHVFELNGEETSELYPFYDYAENMKRDEVNNIYLILAKYLYENPEYFKSLQLEHFDLGDSTLIPNPEHFKIKADGITTVISGLHIMDHCGLDATIFIMTDENVFLSEVDEFYNLGLDQFANDTIITLSYIAVTGIVALTSLICVSRGVTKPLKIMSEDIAKMQELDFKGNFDCYKSYMTELSHISIDYSGLKQCMARFRCFVPPQIISEMLIEGQTQREVKNMYIATLFCDVANFTKVSHKADQEIVLEFANAFLGGCADVIVKFEGTVIDFFGDQIFAIFNAPVEDVDFQKNAITAASRIIKLFDKAKKYFVKKDPIFNVLDVRIGLHCGSSIVGKVGSEQRLKYCAIGENVNLGSRLENINKRYKSRMACSSDFLYSMPRDVKRLYVARPMEFIRVRRREAPVLIYEIAGLAEELSPEVINEFREHVTMFERVKAKRVSAEELEEFIKNAPNSNAKFLRSGSALSDSEI